MFPNFYALEEEEKERRGEEEEGEKERRGTHQWRGGCRTAP